MKLEGLMMTKNKFTKLIEEQIKGTDMSYIDAIINFCEDNNLDPEDIKKYISDPLRNKLESEARKLNYFPKLNELPFDDE